MKTSSRQKTFLGFVLVLALFALNIFVLSPLVLKLFGPFAANASFIVIRMGALFAFSFWLAAAQDLKRWSVIRSASFVMFIEQVAFKAIHFAILGLPNTGQGPATWDGVLFGLAFAYVLFSPVMILVGFVASEAAKQFQMKKKLS